MSSHRCLAIAVLTCFLGGSALGWNWLEEPAPTDESFEQMFRDGNYKEAYQGLRPILVDADADPNRLADQLHLAVQCLQQLGRIAEVDALLSQTVEAHGQNWRLLDAAARTYLHIDHHGSIIAGEFERGGRRGGGRVVNSIDRDRVRALQLWRQAMALAADDAARDEVARLHLSLADGLLFERSHGGSWRLQELTDLKELPAFEEGYRYGSTNLGAPVDAEGQPIYYDVPDSFDEATNDGQRWRWALNQAAEISAQQRAVAEWRFALFLQEQFGVQTLAYFGLPWHVAGDDRDESGTYALHTLGQNETIARLAIGVRRFEMPDEFNYVKRLKALATRDEGIYAQQAMTQLAAEFTNRRQYSTAAEYWRRAIERFGENDNWQDQLDQIVGSWGRFEPAVSQPAGRGAELEFRYRNGRQVEFTAHAIRIDNLLTDVKEYLESNPDQLDWQKLQIDQIGMQLVAADKSAYLGEEVAKWSLELDPRPDHFDRRITVSTPLEKAGAYLVTAKMADGNTTHIVVWLNDTVLVKKGLGEATYLFVADAVTGEPLPRVNVEFFGYRHDAGRRNRSQIATKNFAEFSDQDGQVSLDDETLSNPFNWLIVARTPEGRLAHLGFTNVWYQRRSKSTYAQHKVFAITDRPVYRPNQTVEFKFWIAEAKYDAPDESIYAGKQFEVELHDPRGDKIFSQKYTADAYGGISGSYELSSEALLGTYQLSIPGRGNGSFRVEEYKKPEFEVTVEAPSDPVKLGESFKATIRADYYFGAPVTQARVHYKVIRSKFENTFYPVGPWDWLYGRGYMYLGNDYTWYPGWRQWGCPRPLPPWWGQPMAPPEIVSEAEVEIGADGTVEVEIDTALAAELHGDTDHRYQITAEVVDQSRRTIVGSGEVLAGREPFDVLAWTERGYYRVGNTIRAKFRARTLDQQPVAGQGQLKLLKISYNEDAEPVETEVAAWDLATDAQGQAEQLMQATEAGQYRLSYRLTNKAGQEIEGGYIFLVIGEGFDGADYRFSHLELIPDKTEYQPGEKVQLLINTDRIGSTVVLFARPSDGSYTAPRVIRLTGKSTSIELDIEQADMPNFYVEAFTIADGKFHTVVQEIVVPPVQRVLNVEVTANQKTYRPGEEAEVRIKLTDLDGRPVVGSNVLSVYDKAVEYISGGSNVPEIREFFWKWRRNHYPQSETNLQRYSPNLAAPNQEHMQNLGIFGETAADEGFGAPGRGFGGDGIQMQRGAVRLGAEMMESPQAAPMDLAVADEASAAKAGDGDAALVEPTVRQQFADTALWIAALETDGDGIATVRVPMPENLTTWKFKVWSMGSGVRVGQAETEAVTTKNLLVRLQAPRFFVERDEVVLSANVHNYLDSEKQVQVSLELEGGTLEPLSESTQTVIIGAGGEQRVDWRVRATAEGTAVIRMAARTDEESDAVQMSFPVKVHGMLKLEALAGSIRPDDSSAAFEIVVPDERRVADSRLEIRYSPTLAGAMVDALPYLVDYPYGCTEQTLNRFLPTVITQRILQSMDLDLQAIADKRTNLNPQELGDDRERAERWKQFDRNPVFDVAEVERMTKAGVNRLTEMQLSDGGWGWFSGSYERSSAHTTAIVVHGLQIAQQNDVALVPGVLEQGVEWLSNYQQRELDALKNEEENDKRSKMQADNLDAFVYMVLVDAGRPSDAMREFLYRDRTHLSVYALAMFGLALHQEQQAEQLEMVLRNLEQYLVRDAENQTAYLRLPESNYWWMWYGSEFEAQAYYLKLLAATDPQGETTAWLVKYLLNNRQHATYWNSTRDTAIAVEALADYLRATGEHRPDLTVEVWVDGEMRQEATINAENLFSFDNQFVLVGEEVLSGARQIELRKRGEGPLYFNAYLTNFTLEDPITAAGLEVKVQRRYYRLVRDETPASVAGSRGQALGQAVERYQRVPLEESATLESGDLVEVELIIDSKNDYEYLIFDDPKAAGFEPVEVQSGYTGNRLGAYMELRDDRVSFFVRQLPRGQHAVTYRVRAEIPGDYSALPTHGYAMYAPELQGNSDERKVHIED